MANKVLNTRIQVRYDSYSNWTTKNPVLLKGEIAVAHIDSGSTEMYDSVGLPQYLIKVGDGTSTYTSLQFISAKAADVYAWAKSANPVYKDATGALQPLSPVILSHISDIADLKADVEALQEFQNGNSSAVSTAITNALANLKHTTSGSGKVVTNVTQANGIVTVTKGNLAIADLTDGTLTINGLKDRLDDLEAFQETVTNDYATDAELNALETRVNTKIGTDINTAKSALIGSTSDAATANTINGAKAAANAAQAAAEAAQGTADDAVADAAAAQATANAADTLSKANKARLDTLQGADTGKTVRAISAEEVAKIVAGADAKYDTLKEIADYIISDTTGAAEMAGDITDLQGRVKAIEDAPYATTANVATAKSEVIGASGNASTANTIYGAKKYADEKAEAAKNAVLGTASDTQEATTVNGVKKLAGAALGKANDANDAAGVAQQTIDNYITSNNTRVGNVESKANANETAIATKAAQADLITEVNRATAAEEGLGDRIDEVEGKALIKSDIKVGTGLKVTPSATNNNVTIDIDSGVTFIFDCGDASGTALGQ